MFFLRVVAAGLSRQFFVDLYNKTVKRYKELKAKYPAVICHMDNKIQNVILDKNTGI